MRIGITSLTGTACPQPQKGVQGTLNFLIKGCSCKKGCVIKHAVWVSKKGNNRGSGCGCQGCTNLPGNTLIEDDYMNEEDSLDQLEGSDLSGSTDEEEDKDKS